MKRSKLETEIASVRRDLLDLSLELKAWASCYQRNVMDIVIGSIQNYSTTVGNILRLNSSEIEESR